MKYIFLTLNVLLFVTLSARGQISEQLKNSTPEERAQKITDWMKTNLQLSDEQATGVHAVNLKYASQNEALKEEGSARRKNYRKLKENQAAKDQELKNVLTAEQFTTYLKKKKELQEKMREEVREQKN